MYNKNQHMNFISEKITGFTIIELVISIFILSIGIIGIFGAFSVVTILTSDSADRLTATYLAQEGMEIVRNIRDTNWLNMNACVSGTVNCQAFWYDGLNNCTQNNGGCYADYTSKSMSSGDGGFLQIDKDGFYSYKPCSPNVTSCNSKFKRGITINCMSSDGSSDTDCVKDHIMKVITKVSWNKKATILSPYVSADSCCPDRTNPKCPVNVSNCVTTEETLYDWYNRPSSATDFNWFKLINSDGTAVYTGVVDLKQGAITVTGVSQTDASSLVATFSVSPESQVAATGIVNGIVTTRIVTSGNTDDFYDFSNTTANPIKYTVIAGDGTTKDYPVTVNPVNNQ